jgi:hypothetical protein
MKNTIIKIEPPKPMVFKLSSLRDIVFYTEGMALDGKNIGYR